MSDADARVERKAKRKERKAERKRKKEEKKKARADKKQAAAAEGDEVEPVLALLAGCDDDGLEEFLRRHFGDTAGMTMDRLRMVRDVVRAAMGASAEDGESVRERVAKVHAVLG
jgi:hypothetical protein